MKKEADAGVFPAHLENGGDTSGTSGCRTLGDCDPSQGFSAPLCVRQTLSTPGRSRGDRERGFPYRGLWTRGRALIGWDKKETQKPTAFMMVTAERWF